MGRSRNSSPARRAPARRSEPKSAPAPAPRQAAQPPAHSSGSGGGMLSGLASTVAQGMAFGTGSAIAHRAVGAVANSFSGSSDEPRQENSQSMSAPPAQSAPASQQCYNSEKSFMDCLTAQNNDIGACQFYFDALKQCKQETQASARF